MEYDFREIEEGLDYTATVIDVKDNEIRLDLGYVLEGTIYLNEFTTEKVNSFHDLLKVGDEVVATAKKIDDVAGKVLMSRLGILKKESFKNIVGLFEEEEPIKVKVVRVVNKGLICEYLQHEMFMHESQVDFEPVKLDEYVGQELDVLINNLDKRSQKIKVSRRDLLFKEQRAKRQLERKLRDENRQKEWETMTVGSVHTGTVKEFHPFGAIIAFEFNQGVLLNREVSHYRVEAAEDELSVGDEVEVKVLEAAIKKGRNRLSVSRKAMLKTPYELYADKHKTGDVVEGTVVNKLPFGLLVELDRDVTGLLHNNEISWNPNDNFKASVVFGDKVEVHIVNVDAKNKKVGLSKKSLEDNPWAKVNVKYGDVVTGKVSEYVIGKGFMVTVQGVDAFLPADQVREEAPGKLEDMLAVGEEVEAKVTKAYLNEWKIELSIKQLKSEREREEFDRYIKTQETRTVTLGEQFADVLKKKL